MLQCIGVFGELEEYNAIRKKDADIIKKTGVVGPFRASRNTTH